MTDWPKDAEMKTSFKAAMKAIVKLSIENNLANLCTLCWDPADLSTIFDENGKLIVNEDSADEVAAAVKV